MSMGSEARRSISRYSKDEIMQQWDTLFKNMVLKKKQG